MLSVQALSGDQHHGKHPLPDGIFCPTRFAVSLELNLSGKQETTMAEIFGTGHFNIHTHRYIGFADTLDGTSGNDTIWAGGGNDHVYAGAGDDEVHGGAGDDILVANPQNPYTIGAWGHDAVYGDSGNDIIAYGNTTNSVILYGDDINNQEAGNDTITGGSADDQIYGGGGNDTIYGGGGNDTIYGDSFTGSGNGNDNISGGAGHDSIWGGDGNDIISGGTGFDDLWGGKGADTFVFTNGDSTKSYSGADVIHDFNASTNSYSVWDKLDLDGKATASNFGHINGVLDTSHDFTDKAAYDHALGFAQNVMTNSPGLKYEFVTDGHDGWVFVDANNNHTVDYGIELKGVTDLHWQNIV
jgi:Ca2+-binding RTX toxin-like protein